MSIRETTKTSQLGWPKAGDVDEKDRVPIDFGNGERLWVTDPAWARQLATAATVAANALEARLGIDMLPVPRAVTGEGRTVVPEQTGLMPAIPPTPPEVCGGCGQCPTCQPQPRTDVRVAP